MTGNSADIESTALVVVVRVGAAGGDVTLFGRREPAGAWQFKRVTEDQTEMLFGDAEQSARSESDWVDGWEAALGLLDRYPWAMLHPLDVQVEFKERVRMAVAERLVRAGASRQAERMRGKWVAVLGGDRGG